MNFDVRCENQDVSLISCYISNNARKDNSICECMRTWVWIVRVTALCSLVLFEDRQSETLWLLPVIPGEFDLYLQ